VISALVVFIFRLRMLNSQLYRKGAIQASVPYRLVLRYYWKSVSSNFSRGCDLPLMLFSLARLFSWSELLELGCCMTSWPVSTCSTQILTRRSQRFQPDEQLSILASRRLTRLALVMSLISPLSLVVPNGVFSGSIIANIVKATGKEKIRKTAEWQLLLSTLGLPGCVIGALIVNRLGRRNLSKLVVYLERKRLFTDLEQWFSVLLATCLSVWLLASLIHNVRRQPHTSSSPPRCWLESSQSRNRHA